MTEIVESGPHFSFFFDSEPRAVLSKCSTKTAPRKRRKNEMRKLHFAFKRLHVQTNDFEAFFVLAGQVLEKGIFHPLLFILHGCVLWNNSPCSADISCCLC